MVDSSYILAPPIVQVRFAMLPALNALESIRELNEISRLSGLGDWVTRTAASLLPERLELNHTLFQVFEPLFFYMMPPMTGYSSFLSYVDVIAALDATTMRHQLLEGYMYYLKHSPSLWDNAQGELTPQRLLDDEDAFVRFIMASCENTEFNEALVRNGYRLIQEPARLQATIVEHLRWIWNTVLADEWARVEPMLHESAAAFEKLDYTNLTAHEAIRAVTTRDVRGKLIENMEAIDTIVFVPAAHIGPYIVQISMENILYVIFGARLPRGVQVASSALSRSEILTRLNALADDTRLRILELLTRNEEMCAQDIIETLELSQSSVSRHLSQLSATGFITERRREVSKCYSLNPERVNDTLRTLSVFLARGNPPPPPLPPRAPFPPLPPERPGR